jgi:hypothetical protein
MASVAGGYDARARLRPAALRHLPSRTRHAACRMVQACRPTALGASPHREPARAARLCRGRRHLGFLRVQRERLPERDAYLAGRGREAAVPAAAVPDAVARARGGDGAHARRHDAPAFRQCRPGPCCEDDPAPSGRDRDGPARTRPRQRSNCAAAPAGHRRRAGPGDRRHAGCTRGSACRPTGATRAGSTARIVSFSARSALGCGRRGCRPRTAWSGRTFPPRADHRGAAHSRQNP